MKLSKPLLVISALLLYTSIILAQAQTAQTLEDARALENLGARARTSGNPAKAEEYSRQALAIRQKLAPGSVDVAFSLDNLGNISEDRGNLAEAESYYQQALDISQKSVPESLAVARSLRCLGRVAMKRENLAKAEEHLLQALDIEEKLAPRSRSVALDLISLANLAGRREDIAKQEDYYRQALQFGDKLSAEDSAAILTGLGTVSMQRSDYAKAEEYFRQALEIEQRLAPESLSVAAGLNSLAWAVGAGGESARAEEYLHSALDIAQRQAPQSLLVAQIMNNLGGSSYTRTDLAKAEEYFRQAFDIRQKLAPDSTDLAITLMWLGGVSSDRGSLVKAEEYFRQALAIYERVAPKGTGVAWALDGLGRVASCQGKVAKAEEYFHQALSIQDKLVPNSLPEAQTLQLLGGLAYKRHNLPEAERYDRQALAIREKLVPGTGQHAWALFSLASMLREEKQLDAASDFFAQGISAVENQTARLGGTEESHSSFRARFEDNYKSYIDLLIVRKQPELAFHVLESSRARTLLELLATAHVDIHQGGDPALLRRERSLRELIAARSSHRIRLLNRRHTDEQIAALDKQLGELQQQYDDIEAEIRFTSPDYAALTQPQPLSAKQVQQQLLDQNTILLEYSLHEPHSYIWVVSDTSLLVYELPSRKVIEKAARDVYGLLTERNIPIEKETESQRQSRLTQAEAEYKKAAAGLSQMVLGPVAGLLGNKRLLVVADGALQNVPFAALPSPVPTYAQHSSPEAGADASMPLMIDHEIVNLPSASVLAELRRQEMNRQEPPRAVAVLADPVFDKQDERVVSSMKRTDDTEEKIVASPSLNNELAPSVDQRTRSLGRGGYLNRLLWTHWEANAILKVTPPGQAMEALGFRASRATAMSPALAQYRIVHFATHGLLDSEHPERSGLVLSLVNERGEPQNGFLDLEDIYNLNLPVDLVVLSACDTGVGKEIRGEGLMGLTRGFMYAGASRVVASLWSVDDEVTAELMARFYKAMEQDKMSPAAALRAAQVQVSEDERWSSPYYWAGFQIQGEWK